MKNLIDITVLVPFIYSAMAFKGFWARFRAVADFSLNSVYPIKAGQQFHRHSAVGHWYYAEGQPHVIMTRKHIDDCPGLIQPIEHNLGEKLMLVITELAEGVEADRKGRRIKERPEALDFSLVKDTLEDEMADAYIRLCDLIGGYGLDAAYIQRSKEEAQADGISFGWGNNTAANILILCRHVQYCFTVSGTFSDLTTAAFQDGLAGLLAAIESFCIHENIDLATHIDLKMKYNSSRSFKHGKSY